MFDFRWNHSVEWSKSFASLCNHTVPFHQPLNLEPTNTTWTTATISIDVVSGRVAGSFQEESCWPIEASIRGTRRLINGMRQAKDWSRISGWHRLYPGRSDIRLGLFIGDTSGTTFDRDTSRTRWHGNIYFLVIYRQYRMRQVHWPLRSKWKTTVVAVRSAR